MSLGKTAHVLSPQGWRWKKHYTPIVELPQHLKAELVPWLTPHAIKFKTFSFENNINFSLALGQTKRKR